MTHIRTGINASSSSIAGFENGTAVSRLLASMGTSYTRASYADTSFVKTNYVDVKMLDVHIGSNNKGIRCRVYVD